MMAIPVVTFHDGHMAGVRLLCEERCQGANGDAENGRPVQSGNCKLFLDSYTNKFYRQGQVLGPVVKTQHWL